MSGRDAECQIEQDTAYDKVKDHLQELFVSVFGSEIGIQFSSADADPETYDSENGAKDAAKQKDNKP